MAKDDINLKDSKDQTKGKPIYDSRNGIYVDPDTRQAVPKDEGNGKLSDQQRSQVIVSNTAALNPRVVKRKGKGGAFDD